MTGKNDGGSAFPCPGMTGLPNDIVVWPEGGMTLRDYFAGQALNSLLMDRCGESPDEFAVESYGMADAMLRARESS